jgi:hypothetical protein
MTQDIDSLDQWEHAFERRSIGRTKIAKSALLFFIGQTGVRSCGVADITNAGARIRTQDLPALPLNFELSFDNFRTVRKCRLIWRDGDCLLPSIRLVGGSLRQRSTVNPPAIL